MNVGFAVVAICRIIDVDGPIRESIVWRPILNRNVIGLCTERRIAHLACRSVLNFDATRLGLNLNILFAHEYFVCKTTGGSQQNLAAGMARKNKRSIRKTWFESVLLSSIGFNFRFCRL
jgi:hypothetical protein